VLSRIILERLKEALDSKLREEQAGFRQHRSGSDQIITVRIIVEQSIEWNSSLYVNFIDFEKATHRLLHWQMVLSMKLKSSHAWEV